MARGRGFMRIEWAWILATLGSLGGSGGARGQCLDWAPGFGIPGNGVNGSVEDFVVWNDGSGPALYASGGFEMAGGVTADKVARWDGTSWSAVGDVLNNAVRTLEVFDDGSGPALYAGGAFFPSGTSSARSIARLVGSTWTAFPTSPDGGVHTLAVFDDGSGPALYVAGHFTLIGGTNFNRIAKWDGSTWSALGSGTDGDVEALAVFDDGSGPALYAGGAFLSAGGTAAVHVAKWNGSSWSAVGSLPDVQSFAVYDAGGGAKLHAAGFFTGGVRRWNGSIWQQLGSLSGGALSLGVYDDGSGPALYEGGTGEVHRWTGSSWTALGMSPNGPVEALASFDDGSGSGPKLFAGGSYTMAGGRPASNVDYWGDPCDGPVILQHPLSQTAVFNQHVVFSVVAEGTATLTYQWRKDGVQVDNVSGRIEGATTPTMTLYYWDFGDSGSYDCQVLNSFGSATSDPAVLTVPTGGGDGEPIDLARILHPPEPVPDHPGVTYTRFYTPVESSAGEVAFFAEISGSPSGSRSINLWQSGASELLYQDNDPAPGTPSGVVFGGSGANSFLTYVVGANGGVAFFSELSGAGVNSTNRKGIWYRDSVGGELVARLGNPAGGSPPGSTFSSLHSRILVSDAGRVLFYGVVNQSGSFLESGCWHWERSTGQTQVAVTGDPAPGTAASFTSIDATSIVMNHGGTLALTAGITGGGGGVWTGTPGSLQLVALRGDPVSGWPSGSTFQSFNDLVLNEAGDLALQAIVQLPGGSTQRAVFRWTSGTFTPVVIQGDPAPGAAGQTIGFAKPIAMNASGAILFHSTLSGGSCPDLCPSFGYLFADSDGISSIVTNRSDPLPEAPSGFILDHLGPAALNDSGQVVVSVVLYSGDMHGATYGWIREYGLFPIAVPGSQIEVAPDEFRTVDGSEISPLLGGISGDVGISTSLTADGLAILNLGFTDSTLGIYSGQFTGFAALYFPPGTPFCAGDGSLPTPCPCANTGQPDRGCQNSAATGGALLTSFGGASLTEDEVVLTSSGERPTSLSIFLQGTTNLAAGVGYGDGVRCVGGILKRIAARNAVGGVVSYPDPGDLSISARSAMLGNPISPGSTRFYQTYYRDPVPSFCPTPPGNTFNVSSGQIVQWFP